MPATVDLMAFEREAASAGNKHYRLRDCFAAMTAAEPQDATYILIDCPPSLNLLTVNALAAADAVLVRQVLGEKVYTTVIPRNVRVAESPSHGKPVLLYDYRCSGSQAYIQLASEVIERVLSRTARATYIESYTVRPVAFASACASSAKARHGTVSTAICLMSATSCRPS